MAAVQRVECGHAHVKQLLQCLAWVPSIGMNFIYHINSMFGQMGQSNVHTRTFQLYFRLKMWMKQLKRIRCVWSVKWVSGGYISRVLEQVKLMSSSRPLSFNKRKFPFQTKVANVVNTLFVARNRYDMSSYLVVNRRMLPIGLPGHRLCNNHWH